MHSHWVNDQHSFRSGVRYQRDENGNKLEPIEEITVVGQKSLARLRLRISEKETEIYNFFNANNSSPRLDIICIKRKPTGTHLLIRECEPRFLKQLRVEKTRDLRMGIGAGYNKLDLVRWSAQDFEKLQNEMNELMASSNEFARLLTALVELTENYETQRKARKPLQSNAYNFTEKYL